MINVEYEIFRLVSKASNQTITLTESISDGLTAYVADNGLYSILERCPEEKRVYYLELFMRPIMSMRPAAIASYFETYTLCKDYTRIANRIHNESDKKWHDAQYVCDALEPIAADFHAFVGEICKYPSLYEKLGTSISDCTVELEYLAGRSKNISLRMNRKLVEVGNVQSKG